MSAPEPYANTTHVTVHGRVLVVTEHAPNGDSWRYHGTPADLAGDTVTFSHDEASPVTRPMPSPLPETGRALMASAGLSLDVFDQEHRQAAWLAALSDLLDVVREVAHGHGGQPDIHQAWLIWTETV